jgi:hypothetical protein
VTPNADPRTPGSTPGGVGAAPKGSVVQSEGVGFPQAHASPANAETVGHLIGSHPVPAAKWMGYNPWPVCSDCECPVYRSDKWLHFEASLNDRSGAGQ